MQLDKHFQRSASWRRLLAQRRPILEAFYTPEQTHDGPDIKRLTPCKQTKVQPVGEKRNTRLVEQNGQHSKHRHRTSLGQAGQTSRNIRNFQQNLSQRMNNSKAQEQKQYKRPSNQHHRRTHLPYRSWCPTCVQARGRQNTRIAEGCSNKRSSRRQVTERIAIE